MIKVHLHFKDEVNDLKGEVNHLKDLHVTMQHPNFEVHHLNNNKSVNQSLKHSHQRVDLHRLQSFRITGIAKNRWENDS
jgi:hypothetical protein